MALHETCEQLASYFAHRGDFVSPRAAIRTQPIVKKLPAGSRIFSGVAHAPAVRAESNAERVRRTREPQAREVRFHPRAESEWQGMLIDVAVRPPCESTESCQLALACVESTCGPCQADGECGAGERCVLDHCLLRENAGCVNARDCPQGELCMIVSDGSDALRHVRGNLFLRSLCTTDGYAQGSPQPFGEEPEVYQAEDPPALLGPAPNVAIDTLQLSFSSMGEGK